MNINITEFKVEFLQSGSIRFAINSVERLKNDKYPTFYVISRSELPLMLDCINGDSEFYPFFDDGLYHIKVHPVGLNVLEKCGETFKEYYFIYPLKDNKILLNLIENHFNNPVESTYTDINLQDKKFEYRNRSKWIYHHKMHTRYEITPEGYNLIEYPITKLNRKVLADIKTNPELKEYLQRLNRIAHNYCIKDTITIDLSFDTYDIRDDQPASYYFFIHDNGKKILNGGIIAHKHNDNSYQYSMHT